jgi:hypothetical protein
MKATVCAVAEVVELIELPTTRNVDPLSVAVLVKIGETNAFAVLTVYDRLLLVMVSCMPVYVAVKNPMRLALDVPVIVAAMFETMIVQLLHPPFQVESPAGPVTVTALNVTVVLVTYPLKLW